MPKSTFIYEAYDERFEPCTQGDAHLETLYDGCRWAEGPAYFPAARCLVWSDNPNDRMLRYDETSGAVGVFRQPAGYTNGHTVDGIGRLVSCEHGNRRVTRTEPDGSITVIADRFEGKRFNSPNDVVVSRDGAIWFTDPAYGLDSDYEGYRAPSEIGGCHVYRVDPADGRARVVADDFDRPNGLAFSLDERQLYIADSARNHLRLFDVADGGRLTGGDVFIEGTTPVFDGFRLDDTGRIWAGVNGGVHCIDPDGTVIGKILVPERVANVAFGGPRRNRLFLAATTSMYCVQLSVTGAPGPYTSPK